MSILYNPSEEKSVDFFQSQLTTDKATKVLDTIRNDIDQFIVFSDDLLECDNRNENCWVNRAHVSLLQQKCQ